eukprot:g70669.t1
MSGGGGGGGHVHSATCGCSAEKQNAVGVQSLFYAIERDKVSCLGAQDDEMGKLVFKTHDKRLSDDKLVSGEGDPEVIINVSFNCQVKLHSFCVIGQGGTAPRRVLMWKNRDDIDFDNCGDIKPLQEWGLNQDREGKLFYNTQLHKFQNVSSLVLYFPTSHGGEQTEIQYIGLRGVGTQNKRGVVANFVYEARANPKDHQAKEDNNVGHSVS